VRIHCVSSRSKDSLSVVVFCYMLIVDVCWLLWFSCQYLPSDWLERPLWWHHNMVRRLSPQSPGVCVYFTFVWFVYVPMCFPGPTQYIFHMPMTRYSLFVLKMSLNTNKTNKHTVSANLLTSNRPIFIYERTKHCNNRLKAHCRWEICLRGVKRRLTSSDMTCCYCSVDKKVNYSKHSNHSACQHSEKDKIRSYSAFNNAAMAQWLRWSTFTQWTRVQLLLITHMSHWWRQEGHLAKIASVSQ